MTAPVGYSDEEIAQIRSEHAPPHTSNGPCRVCRWLATLAAYSRR